ncbi:splicing factor 3B subunit 1 [Leishmania donovani]|uniref:Splicing factor 3B subunit 1 family protein n=2 Tax=Leishmania donovani TaxID=5661 RepID=A0A504WWZ5_LEIDO|nr:Splicing factor 3B subunit 1 family protein [Leishmania donovani]TPP54400.1 Splicing factor 3B subunit 1 family protein [Leishmania donovani]CAJ1990420.1 splicing factor 3B subunit 1 [Leishmania donovani]
MADAAGGEPQALKKHRWEDPTGFGGGDSGGAMPTSTRWSSATPRQYGADTPRRTPVLSSETSSWRGMATPNATPYMTDFIPTPTFGASGSSGMGGSTPSTFGTPRMGSSGVTAGGGTPLFASGSTPRMGGVTPMFTGATPAAGATFGATPNYQYEGGTPLQSHFASSVETQSITTAAIEAKAKALEKEWNRKNKRLTSEYLDSILPREFFTVAAVPADYNPLPPEEPNFYEIAVRTMDVFSMQAGAAAAVTAGLDANGQPIKYDIPEDMGDGMPTMKVEDAAVFVELLKYHKAEKIPDEHLPSYLLMKNLFKIKNGDTMQRRAGTRYLLDKATIFGSHFIFQRLSYIWSSDILNIEEKHYFIDFIKSLLQQMGKGARQFTKEVIHLVEPLLTAHERILRDDGKQVLTLLTRVVGFQAVFAVIREDFGHAESIVRRHTARVMAVVGYAAGTEEVTAALRDMSYAPSALARQTVVRSMAELAKMVGHALIAALPEMVAMLERLLRDEKRVQRDAALAVAAIAEATAPDGIEELAPLVDVICEECMKGIGSMASPFIQAFGALVPLMSPYDAQARTAAMMPNLVNQFSTPEDEFRRVLISVVRKCVLAEGVTPQFIRQTILEPFFEGFWRVRRLAAERQTSGSLVATTVEIAKKLGSVDVLVKLSPDMKDESEEYQRMVLTAIKKVVDATGMDAAPDTLVTFVLDGAIAAVRQDELGTSKLVMNVLATICNALAARLRPYLKQVFDLIKRRRENREASMRAQTADLVSRIAHTVMLADGAVFLQDLGLSLYERLEDPDARALSANLRAVRSILGELGSRRFKPSVRELLKRLTFVIKSRNSHVQNGAIALIEDIATNYDTDVDAIHLHQLATRGLFELLDSPQRATRHACARTFGVIAKKIRPFAIILELVDNFRQDKRQIRICTAVALSAIAKECGPFTIIPYLLNEYKISEGKQVAVIVQHSVLKAIRYIFEAIGSIGKEYVYPMIPLLERALTETNIQMRRMAVEACRAILLSVAGNDGFEDIALHLLNFVHPNIVELLAKNEVKIGEERLKMVTAVVSYYEAARVVIEPGKLLQYLLQGLFHPARKVRDIYRRTYNLIYVGSPERLVPYYPRIENDASHTYVRHELEVLL